MKDLCGDLCTISLDSFLEKAENEGGKKKDRGGEPDPAVPNLKEVKDPLLPC